MDDRLHGHDHMAVIPVQAGMHSLQAASCVEKPNLATAEAYIQKGGYFWKVVMFVLKASELLKALQQFRPDIAQAPQAPQS